MMLIDAGKEQHKIAQSVMELFILFVHVGPELCACYLHGVRFWRPEVLRRSCVMLTFQSIQSFIQASFHPCPAAR